MGKKLSLIGLRTAIATIAILSAGACSQSPSALLKAGDAHVCVNRVVTDQVLEIVRQNASMPPPSEEMKGYVAMAKAAAQKLKLSLDGVTSNSVDASNMKASCEGQLLIDNDALGQTYRADVTYDVAAKLSDDGDVKVSANVGSASNAMANATAVLIAPAVADNHVKTVEKAAADVAELMKPTAADEAYKKRMAKEYGINPRDIFSPDEQALMKRTEYYYDKCRDGDDNDNECEQSQKLFADLKIQNVCWGPDDVIEADKHWIRCHS